VSAIIWEILKLLVGKNIFCFVEPIGIISKERIKEVDMKKEIKNIIKYIVQFNLSSKTKKIILRTSNYQSFQLTSNSNSRNQTKNNSNLAGFFF